MKSEGDTAGELIGVKSDDNALPVLQPVSTRTGVWQPDSCPKASPHHYKEFRTRLRLLVGAVFLAHQRKNQTLG